MWNWIAEVKNKIIWSKLNMKLESLVLPESVELEDVFSCLSSKVSFITVLLSPMRFFTLLLFHSTLSKHNVIPVLFQG